MLEYNEVTQAAASVIYKERFERKIWNACTNTIKQLWTNLNQISSLCKNKSTSISKLTYNDKDLTESSEICNTLIVILVL